MSNMINLRENVTAKQIRKLTGLSQSKFSALTGIPTRTIEQWEAGNRQSPLYVRGMMVVALEHTGHLTREQVLSLTVRPTDRDRDEIADRLVSIREGYLSLGLVNMDAVHWAHDSGYTERDYEEFLAAYEQYLDDDYGREYLDRCREEIADYLDCRGQG